MRNIFALLDWTQKKTFMKTKRLFIGTFIAPSLFENVYKQIQDDFNTCCSGKWVEPVNLHFTYQFLGDVDESFVPEVQNGISEYLKNYDSELVIKDISALPKPAYPRVLYVNVIDKNGIVKKTQKLIESALLDLGFQPELREYLPHVTLMRIKQSYKHRFGDILEKYRDFKIGTMPSFGIDLIESVLTESGPIYKKI
jgi:2'-5' RNA ligase